jgi:hypothetical protein
MTMVDTGRSPASPSSLPNAPTRIFLHPRQEDAAAPALLLPRPRRRHVFKRELGARQILLGVRLGAAEDDVRQAADAQDCRLLFAEDEVNRVKHVALPRAVFPQGSCSSCIAIRTIIMTGDTAMIQAVRAVVHDGLNAKEAFQMYQDLRNQEGGRKKNERSR